MLNTPENAKTESNSKEKLKSESISEQKDEEEIHSNINLKESSDSDSESKSSNSKSSKNSSSDCESIGSSIDEERLTLGQINHRARLAQKKNAEMNIRSFLQHKRHLDSRVITYDEKEGKIVDEFCGSYEELNDFLNKCEIKKITFDDINNNKDNVIFDPNQWMKENQINKKVISLEDMQIYYQNKNPKKKEKEKKEFFTERKIKGKIQKEKIRSIYLKDKKTYEDYINLKKIVECKKLSIEQKEWVSNLITTLKSKDINDIIIEKNSEGKYNKLELVFDLDNTCIFSFLSHYDVLLVQKNKNTFPQKDIKMISFKFNNKVLYAALIIRKGLKEFLNYVSPLCNFHISTLGAESYGNEVKDILSEYTGVEFIRYKGRMYNEEYCKNIADLYINGENVVIFDDYARAWENNTKDNEQVIITKYFFDEQCSMLHDINYAKEKNEENKNAIEAFLKSYKTLCYSKIKDPKNNISESDWKNHEIIEYQNIPFYQFKKSNDFNYNKCFTAEYLDSPNYQFILMKEIVKVIYWLKFVFDIDIRLAIKLIKICTLNNMKFDLKYLADDQKHILTDMIKVCGGMVYDKNYNYVQNKGEKIYLVVSKRFYESKKEGIKTDLQKNSNYFLINEKFILDTYYFMTDLRSHINDPEYTSF